MTYTILYVEDDPLNVRLVQRMFTDSGYTLYDARSGKEGYFLAQKLQPDLILMDINLPDIDGLQVTARLKANPATANIPIIALTANGMFQDRREALNAGCEGFIQKPVSRVELLKTVQQFLRYVAHA